MINPAEVVYRAKELTPTQRRDRINNITEEIRKLNNSITVTISDAKDEEGFKRRISGIQATIDKLQKQIDDATNRRDNAKELVEAAAQQIQDLSQERTILQNIDDVAKALALKEKLDGLGISAERGAPEADRNSIHPAPGIADSADSESVAENRREPSGVS
jgi:hypothetical protein